MRSSKLEGLVPGKDYVSNNSASTFRACPRRFNLEYVQKIRPIHQNISLYFGVAIHQALDYYFKECPDPDLAVEYFRSVFDGEINEKPIMWSLNGARKDGGDFKDAETAREYGAKMLSAYFNYWFDENQDWEVLASEVDFEIKVGNIIYTGIIDKIIKEKSTGKIYVVDHKTLAQRYSGEFVNNDMAITGYILGAEKLGFKVDGAIYDYLMKLKEPKFERVYTIRTQEQVDDFKESTVATVKAIQAGVDYKHISKECSYCRFQKYCSRDPQASELYFQEK